MPPRVPRAPPLSGSDSTTTTTRSFLPLASADARDLTKLRGRVGSRALEQVIAECHMSWRLLVGKAESGEDVPRNLSVSRLSELADDIDPEHIMELQRDDTDEGAAGEAPGVEGEDGGELEEGEEQYPTSLIA